MKSEVIQTIPACIYVLFAGPWSDRHGRKFLIGCCLFGYVIANAVFLINLYFFYELGAEFLLFEALQGKYFVVIILIIIVGQNKSFNFCKYHKLYYLHTLSYRSYWWKICFLFGFVFIYIRYIRP